MTTTPMRARHRRPGLRFAGVIGGAVDRRVIAGVKEAICRFSRIVPVHHYVPVFVYAAPALRSAKGHGFGYFSRRRSPRSDRWLLRIGLAGDLCLDMVDETADAMAIESVQETLAHELGHYEQFRDDRPFTEDDANRRADEIMKSAGIRSREMLFIRLVEGAVMWTTTTTSSDVTANA